MKIVSKNEYEALAILGVSHPTNAVVQSSIKWGSSPLLKTIDALQTKNLFDMPMKSSSK